MAAAATGLVLAAIVAVAARRVGLDRDRAFYPTVLIVVGSYYVLFAAMAGRQLGPEILFFAVFAAAAVLGFRHSLWIVVGGLATHGLFDLTRGGLLDGRGVPDWWPAFCAAYDVAAAAILAVLLLRMPGARPLDSTGPR